MKPDRIRKGQAPPPLGEAAFRERFATAFADPAFAQDAKLLHSVATVAWHNYRDGRKAPVTQPAGKGFADPEYQLSVEWRGTRDRLRRAEAVQRRASTPRRVLVVAGAARNDGSCPGEMSKTFRLANIVADTLRAQRITPDLLDLSLLTSDYRRYIHPCKGCVSTAMPLCHWPCSCYPNHANDQTGDWMADIYERWVAAHGVIIVTPVYWYQAPSVLKLMMDRLVCADGGNPDPTSTSGKNAAKAKQLELAGWPYPKHLAGRVYGVFVHGDVAGIESLRRSLCDWLDWMGLVDAGQLARIDRYIGYYEPYASSHRILDADKAVQEEVRNLARAVAEAVGLARAGKLPSPGSKLKSPRPK